MSYPSPTSVHLNWVGRLVRCGGRSRSDDLWGWILTSPVEAVSVHPRCAPAGPWMAAAFKTRCSPDGRPCPIAILRHPGQMWDHHQLRLVVLVCLAEGIELSCRDSKPPSTSFLSTAAARRCPSSRLRPPSSRWVSRWSNRAARRLPAAGKWCPDQPRGDSAVAASGELTNGVIYVGRWTRSVAS
jgi:hypothetical protein